MNSRPSFHSTLQHEITVALSGVTPTQQQGAMLGQVYGLGNRHRIITMQPPSNLNGSQHLGFWKHDFCSACFVHKHGVFVFLLFPEACHQSRLGETSLIAWKVQCMPCATRSHDTPDSHMTCLLPTWVWDQLIGLTASSDTAESYSSKIATSASPHACMQIAKKGSQELVQATTVHGHPTSKTHIESMK